MGIDMMDPDYGRQYVKYSREPEEHFYGSELYYMGEWSEESKRPNGRGILIGPTVIKIGYFQHG